MKFGDIETLADAAAYFRENTPPPVRKWYGLKCPRCGRKFINSLYGTWMNYDIHYMAHLIEDKKNQS